LCAIAESPAAAGAPGEALQLVREQLLGGRAATPTLDKATALAVMIASTLLLRMTGLPISTVDSHDDVKWSVAAVRAEG